MLLLTGLVHQSNTFFADNGIFFGCGICICIFCCFSYVSDVCVVCISSSEVRCPSSDVCASSDGCWCFLLRVYNVTR